MTHLALVHERFLDPLSRRQVEELMQIWDTAVLGIVNAKVWPPAELRAPIRR